MRVRLTETNVLRLPCKTKPYRVQDSGSGSVRGLHILVQPTGTRTYRCDTKQGAVRLGRVEDFTLTHARDLALEALRSKANAAHEGIKVQTFDKALTAYTKHQLVANERIAAKETDKWVRFNCGSLLQKNCHEITKSELIKLLEGKRDGGHAPSSNRLYAHFKTFFKYCRKKGHVAVDPMLDVDKPWNPRADRLARKRSWFNAGSVTDDIIRAIWCHADSIGGDRGRFFKLLLITAKRCNAVADMRWEHITGDDWYWQPPYRSDIKKNLPVTLPKLAQRVLSPRQQTGKVLHGLNEFSYMAGKVKNVPSDFYLHSIRSICATKLADLKVPPHIARMVLDHSPFSDIHEKHYQHGSYRTEVAAALEAWSQHIEGLIQPEAGIAVLR